MKILFFGDESMNVIVVNEPKIIRSVEANAIRSILDSVPVRELEAVKLEPAEDEANS
jgi:hypothetical protein